MQLKSLWASSSSSGLVWASMQESFWPKLWVVDGLLIKKVYQDWTVTPSRPAINDGWKFLRDKIMLGIRMFRIARIVWTVFQICRDDDVIFWNFDSSWKTKTQKDWQQTIPFQLMTIHIDYLDSIDWINLLVKLKHLHCHQYLKLMSLGGASCSATPIHWVLPTTLA